MPQDVHVEVLSWQGRGWAGGGHLGANRGEVVFEARRLQEITDV